MHDPHGAREATTKDATNRGRHRTCSYAVMPRSSHTRVLGLLLVIVALNAFGGGYYGLAGAKGVPKEWLASSPFPDYLVPSLMLLFIVGGASLGAAMAVLAGLPGARRVAAGAGVVILVWIAAEVAIIGAESWLQAATALVGAMIVALALGLPKVAVP